MSPRAPKNAQVKCRDCDRPFHAKGLCSTHYKALSRGTYTPTKPKTKTQFVVDPDDFWEFVKKELRIG